MVPPGEGQTAKSPKLLLPGKRCVTGCAMAQSAIAQSCDLAVCFPTGNPSSRGAEVLGGPRGLCPVSCEVTTALTYTRRVSPV